MVETQATEAMHQNDAVAQRQWFIVGRWQEYDGEWRANLVRTISIAAFYGVELLGYYGLNLGWLQIEQTFTREFHLAISSLAAAWVIVAFGTFYCLRMNIFPAALKYITTGCDIVVLTTMLAAASGPRSPLVAGYFVVIAVSALRLQLPLVWCATIGSMGGYLFLLGFAKWHDVWLGLPHCDLMVPRYAQLIMFLALGMTGITLGQVIRRVKAMAEDYARRMKVTTEIRQ
jgi:hypothetical protein